MATSIGTAWIQIKPTTKSLRTAVESGLNGQQIGNTFWKSFSASSVGFISGVASTITSKLSSVVSSLFSDAIDRADTLTRFPKVMSLLGYSAEEASSAINKLWKGVETLPTDLADVVSYTQRLVGVAGGLDKASDWTLAISDAMIAVTGNAEKASRSTEQFVQAIMRGKPMGNDWNTVMENASTTMNMLAKSLGYTSAEINGEFYQAWQSGKLSTEEIMDALVKLDKEGGESMTSFHKLAEEAVGGFATSLIIMKQQVKNITTGLLMGNQEMIERGLNGIIETIPKILPQLMSAFAMTVLTLLKAIPSVIPQFVDIIVEQAPTIIDAVADVILAVADNLPRLLDTIIAALPKLVSTIGTALGKLFESESFWKMATIGGLLIGGKFILGKVGSFFKNIFAKKIGSDVGGGITKTISNVFGTIGKSIKALIEPLAKTISTVFKELGKGIAGFFTAFANPKVLLGMALFAAGLVAIGLAMALVGPQLKAFIDDILLPIATFLRDTLLLLIEALTTAIIRLTTDAIIPLGEFLAKAFLAYIRQMTESIILVTNQAIIPLLSVLSGTFTQVIKTIADLITGTLYVALEGIRSIVEAIGDAFLKMGQAIKTALDGVRGVLQVFADIILGISDALVAIVALATHQSVNYGRGFAFVTGAATGGLVNGIGTETSDSNLYALSKGEYVIRAAAARQIGYDNLDAMNETGTITGGVTNNFTINGYQKSPEELANIISRKIAFNTQGVIG